MLDLIDSTTLTSLPFPPPPKRARRSHESPSLLPHTPTSSSSSQINLHNPLLPISPTRAYSDPEINQYAHSTAQSNPVPSHAVLPSSLPDIDHSFTSIDTIASTSLDDTFHEDEPIIFVEDYLQPKSSSLHHKRTILHRKQSLATFKQRINGDKKRRISLHEDLEQIFGTLPGKNLLKHCEICDKPLYEISSLINNKSSVNPKLDMFNEFICSECIVVYEEFLTQLYSEEFETEVGLPELKNLKLLNMFKTIQLRSNPRKISNNLISRLKFLNSTAITSELHDLNEINWLKSLQNKLRWRWRLNGLVPALSKKSTASNH